jgi:hypothetical protein
MKPQCLVTNGPGLAFKQAVFCEGGGCIHHATCPHALTPQVLLAAREARLPVARCLHPKKLQCFQGTVPPAPRNRQRSYQIRQQALGLCILCSRPAVTRYHCALHGQRHADRCRNYARKKAGIPFDVPLLGTGKRSPRDAG